ncbi:LPS biosynthesis protein WavE [Vibrio crassostreae]|nr:LPS biosynthesis protein WavE [Vibrio crassostreae]CAK2313562.1 LPS biosynthesis protein WavE [Vibrio crassostreae]CAK2451611.1 LPS biosynthesis protein WavE [Vibrio crassostreae]CAK2769482.1 LPS biosynthesis protein WavE [Vibrio crassostreae]
MIDFKDITVVVQGPVQNFNDRPQEPNITIKCLNSVREHLPGAQIILSTWPEQDLTGLDFDELVISPDPGSNSRNYTLKGEPQKYNNNRQIVSSVEGLKRVKTKYALKLRSDNYLTSNHFVELQQKYLKRSDADAFLEERVVVCDIFSRKYAKGYPVAYHISDFFYFGLTKDVLSLWDFPLFKDFEPSGSQQISPGYPNFIIDCTQALFLAALKQFDSSIQLEHLLDRSHRAIERSNQIIANNLVVAPASEFGLGLCLKFLGKARVSRTSGKVAHIQFFEWELLYKRYCDRDYKITGYYRKKIGIFLLRCIHVFPSRFETLGKLHERKKNAAMFLNEKIR